MSHPACVRILVLWRRFRSWCRVQVRYWPGLSYTLALVICWCRRLVAVTRIGAGRVRVAGFDAATRVTALAVPVWRRVMLPVWRLVEQPVRDAGAWLWHTFPRLAVRTLVRWLARCARWTPGALVRVFAHAAVGAGLLLRHLGRYCVGYRDYAGQIVEAQTQDRHGKAFALRSAWRRTALLRTLSALVGVGGAVLGAWMLTTAYGPDAAVLLSIVLMAGCAGVGRAARPPKQSEAEAVEAEADESAPFPLADAHTRAEAADATARALCAEGIELRMTGEVVRTRWGWEVSVMLRRGTPALVTAKTGELETHLDLPAGGVLVTPDRARRAHVTMRLAQRDPFTGQASAPYRLPHSGTVTDRAVIGDRIDGLPLEIPLLGVHGVIIGSPGSGKSTTLAGLADAITATADAVVWDFDPAGLGLDMLGDAVGRRERDLAGIEDGLADALALAQARPRLLRDLAMGAAWVPSSKYPAVVVIIDEYPRLSDRAKELAVQLLRVGRKSRVTVLLAATEATSDALGASIAELAALKVLHSCRSMDIRLVLGPNMAAEGWRPDRLHPATADDPGNVGQCYVATAGMREPLIAKVHPLDPDATTARAAERAEAGVPRIDAESWSAARTLRASGRSGGGAEVEVGTGERVDHQALTDVVAAFGEDHRLWTSELLVRLAVVDPQRYGQWASETLAIALRPLGVSTVQIKRGGINRNGYDRDAITDAYRALRGRP